MGAVKRNTLSVLFIIKKSKLLKNGEAPICMRITVNKRVAEVMIKRSIPVDLWNQKKECSKGKDRVAIELNHYINTVRAKILQIHRELEIDNKTITADIIKDCFYGRDKYDNTNTIMRIARHTKRPILDIHPSYIADSKAISDKKNMDKLVVLLSGSPRRIYHDILDIIDGGDEKLKLQESDTFIVASPVLPGTEKIANRAINELYKTDTQIHVLKNKELQSMHASEEDIKVLIQILNPKYFIPIKGEYQHFVAVSDVAKKMSIKDDYIIIVDNGEIITFNDGKLQDYRDSITIEDVMIDGLGIGDVGVKVIDDRNQLQNDGVVIIGMTIDGKTKEIVANTDVQTRGFIYLKDSENIVRAIIEMAEKELEAYKKDDNGDIRDVRQTIKDKANRYIIKETGKRPVILPVIIEL